jgi:hypothetical protein
MIAVTVLRYAHQEPLQELHSTHQNRGMLGSELTNAGRARRL